MFIKVKNNSGNDVYLNINHIQAIRCITHDDNKKCYLVIFGDAENSYIEISEDEFNKIKKYIESGG